MSESFWESAFVRAGIKGIVPGAGGSAQVEPAADPAADEIASFRYQTPVVGHGVQAATNANTAHALNERNVVRPTAESLGLSSAAHLQAARQAEADRERERMAGLRGMNTGGIQTTGTDTGSYDNFYGTVRQSIRRAGWGER